MLLSGASLKDVKEIIGHSDISMTDCYSHLTVTHKTQIQDQLTDHYDTQKVVSAKGSPPLTSASAVGPARDGPWRMTTGISYNFPTIG
jgi:hypothetical protein